MKLSPHQRRILLLLAHGLKRREIYKRLGIKPSAYDCAMQSLMRRNGATNHVQLGMLAERSDVLSIDERNAVLDRQLERVDERRRHGGKTITQFLESSRR